jgi:ABC-type transport system involved in cytochrome c biogenesis permease subunit
MPNWLFTALTIWFPGLLTIAGVAYMLGGYKPWPRTAQAFWLLCVLWLLGGIAYAIYPRSQPLPFHVTAGGSISQLVPLPHNSTGPLIVAYRRRTR